MSKIKDGGPAFPQPDLMEDGVCLSQGETGMTLRDYFAAKAMQGLDVTRYAGGYSLLAENAYKIADAMLEVRERGE